jgi:SAM-dependent methyltransferase
LEGSPVNGKEPVMPDTDNDEPARLEWTLPLIAAFWDFQAGRSDLHEMYFSKMVGLGFLKLVERHVKDLGEVADFGCGPGYLLELLLHRGVRCWALDYSQKSLDQVVSRFGKHAHFAGAAVIDAPTRQSLRVDTVFCLETLEHLLPQLVDETLDFLRAILRPGGRLVLTVPNEERLESADTFCPQCRHVFHRWQHLSSWTGAKLQSLLEKHGFAAVYCQAVNLWPMQLHEVRRQEDWWGGKLWESFLQVIDTRRHAENLWKLLKGLLKGHSSVVDPSKPANLIYIGRVAK